MNKTQKSKILFIKGTIQHERNCTFVTAIRAMLHFFRVNLLFFMQSSFVTHF